MATMLDKPVTREVKEWCRKGLFGFGGQNKRNLLVTLMPGPIISFRLKGMKTTVDVDMETVYNMAVKNYYLKQKAEKAVEKAIERKAKRGMM